MEANDSIPSKRWLRLDIAQKLAQLHAFVSCTSVLVNLAQGNHLYGPSASWAAEQGPGAGPANH